MNKKFLLVLVLAALGITGLWAGWKMEQDQSVLAYNKNNLIRFHVIANSNSAEDQALKYQVRDVIVKAMAHRFENIDDIDRARQVTRESLSDIKELAAGHIQSSGYNYPVQVSLGDYPFPAKSYNLGHSEGETKFLTLPADTYEAVRVVIGEGKGDNWWCVLFPPLCFVDFGNASANSSLQSSPGEGDERPDQEDEEANDAVQAFKLVDPGEMYPDNEFEDIEPDKAKQRSERQSVELKFRCVELYKNTMDRFARTFESNKA